MPAVVQNPFPGFRVLLHQTFTPFFVFCIRILIAERTVHLLAHFGVFDVHFRLRFTSDLIVYPAHVARLTNSGSTVKYRARRISVAARLFSLEQFGDVLSEAAGGDSRHIGVQLHMPELAVRQQFRDESFLDAQKLGDHAGVS